MFQSQTEQCQNCQKDFTIEPEDFEFYDRMKVPAPTWCPECRTLRRFFWRNERHLFKRKCDATGKNIFSLFHSGSPLKVYDLEYWQSDAWDPADYAMDYNPSRPFFEQLKELFLRVPWFNRSVQNLINSDYCMNANDLKDCYLLFGATSNEHCYYGVVIQDSRDSFDNYSLYSSELCYECSFCEKCYDARYSFNCADCRGIVFCEDCRNCQDCFGCVGLRNKQYCIFNEQYSREDYGREIKAFNMASSGGVSKIKNIMAEMRLKFPKKYVHGSRNSNCSGEYIFNSKNVRNSYLINGCEDLKYCQGIITKPGAKDCYDYSIWGNGAELIYECSQVGIGASNLKFCAFMYPNCRDLEYSINCHSSADLFGCIALKNKQHCILNKQYSKDEYEALRKKIIDDMNANPFVDARGRAWKYGEFFPFDISPFAYNDSIAQEFFPLDKKTAEQAGVLWRDSEAKDNPYTVSWRDLPDDIRDADDSILNETILCRSWDEDAENAMAHNCSKAFRIVPDELKFYREKNIPLPRRCFNSRHTERIKQRNPLKLWKRQCRCAGEKSENGVYQNTAEHHHHGKNPCPEVFETSYAPDRPEIVYCEKCYQADVA